MGNEAHNPVSEGQQTYKIAEPLQWRCAKHGIVQENLEFKGLDPEIDGLYCMWCWAEMIRSSCHLLVEVDKDGNDI